MMLWFRSIWTILMSFVLSNPLIAQFSNFQQYSQENGLSQSYAYAINQTPDGYLWIGTGDGLSRFDGLSFVNYKVANGLAEDFVTCISVDSTGQMLIGHNQGKLSIYNNEEDSFSVFFSDSLFSSKINQILIDSNKVKWILFQNEGLLRIDGDAQKKYRLPTTLSYYSFQFDEEGNILLATSDGLWFGQLTETGEIKAAFFPELQYEKINQITKSDEGYLIATGVGLFNFSLESGLDHLFEGTEIANENIQQVLFTKNGIWCALRNNGLIYLPSLNEANQVKLINETKGLPSNYTLCLFEDREKNIWTGFNGTGISMYNGGAFELNPFGHFDQTHITAIIKTSAGETITGTTNGIKGLQISVPPNLPKKPVTSLVEDDAQTIWIGYKNHGLYTWHKPSGKVTQISEKNGFQSRSINEISLDKKGGIWVATPFLGVYHFRKDGEIIRYSTENGLLHNNVKNLYCDSNNQIWIITPNTGISYIKDGKINYFTKDPILKTIGFNCIIESPDKTLWFGTNGSGILKYDGQKFINFTTEEGLLSNYIYFLTLDEEKIWAGSRNGLISLGIEDLKIETFSHQKELKSIEITSNALFDIDTKEILFGTNEGLLIYYSSKKTPPIEPSIQLDKLLVFDDTLKPRTLTLPFDSYKLRFTFKGISFKNPEALKYQYILEGFDSEWSGFTSEPLAQYQRVEDGEYSFKVRAINSDDLVSNTASFQFSIKKPIWKQWWFFALMIAFIGSLGYGYNYFKIKRLRLRNKELETRVAERTEQLEARTDELEKANIKLDQQKTEIETSYTKLVELESFKDSMTNMIVHDLKNPLNSVINLSDSSPIIRQAGQQMLNMVMNILDVHKLEEASLKLKLEEYPIKLAIDEAIFQTELLVREKGLDFQQELKGGLIVNMDYDLIVRVLVNLLTNAIKYTPVGGKISVSCVSIKGNEKQQVKVSVIDNGPGITQEYQHQVFEKYKQIDQKHSGLTASTGLGLTFCKLAIEAHHGTIGLESEEGIGSEFYFLLDSVKEVEKTEETAEEFSIGKVEINLSKEDKNALEPHLLSLQRLDIFDTSENMDIISKVNYKSPSLDKWKAEFEMAIYSFNEDRYKELLQMI